MPGPGQAGFNNNSEAWHCGLGAEEGVIDDAVGPLGKQNARQRLLICLSKWMCHMEHILDLESRNGRQTHVVQYHEQKSPSVRPGRNVRSDNVCGMGADHLFLSRPRRLGDTGGFLSTVELRVATSGAQITTVSSAPPGH